MDRSNTLNDRSDKNRPPPPRDPDGDYYIRVKEASARFHFQPRIHRQMHNRKIDDRQLNDADLCDWKPSQRITSGFAVT